MKNNYHHRSLAAAQPSGRFITKVNRLFNHYGVRRFFLKGRNPLMAATVLTAMLLLPKSPWFWGGLALSLCGAIAQWWCFACIFTSKELAQNGPYRFVRNPMYLARYTLVLGLFLMLNPTLPWRWIGPVAFTIFYGFFMHNRVRREEVKLEKLFGAPYLHYLQAVPRFLPSLRSPYPGKTLYWNRDAFKRNNGLRNMAFVLAGYLAACLLTYHDDFTNIYRELVNDSASSSLTQNSNQ